jgi:hypothetical protein
MTMAKGLAGLGGDLVEDEGNFCTVETMIFLPSSMNLRRSPECSAWPTVAPTCMNCLMVAGSGVEHAPVGDHDDRVEHLPAPSPSRFRPISWCASQAMEFDLPLPAECWIR